MLSHITHSAPGAPNQPGQEAQKQYILFDANSASNFSATFDVNQQPWYIQAFNLAEDDIVYVQMASGSGSGVFFSNLFQFGTAVQLNETKNKLRIDMPGRYRLSFSGASVQAIKVTAFPATMTHESTAGIAEALTEIIDTYYTASVAIEAGTGITITGNGGVLDPYIISATGTGTPGGADTNIQFNDGGVFGGESTLTYNKTENAVGIGSAPSADARITLGGTNSASMTHGISYTETFSASASVRRGYAHLPTIAAGQTIVSNVAFGTQITKGAGASAELHYGLVFVASGDNYNYGVHASDGAGTDLNVSFYSQQNTGHSPLDWAVYCTGNAPSKFGAEGIVVTPLVAGTPAVLEDGKIWYDDTTDTLKVRLNGVTKTFTVT